MNKLEKLIFEERGSLNYIISQGYDISKESIDYLNLLRDIQGVDEELTLIISAFPGCGKSFAYNNGINSSDSDSSEFSWIKDANGNNTKERNSDFPNNYINYIKELKDSNKVDIIFVSSHKVVRDALIENDIPFILIYPKEELKEEYLERYKQRGNDQSFINMIDKNWDNFIEELNNQDKCYKIQLSSNQFIKDLLV